jgi:hypothetical protein
MLDFYALKTNPTKTQFAAARRAEFAAIAETNQYVLCREIMSI